MPMAVVRGAAELYLAGDPSEHASFTDFFIDHGLDNAEAYSGMYSASALLEACGLRPPTGPASDYIEYSRIGYHLDRLLMGASQDTLKVCRAVRPFLLKAGAEEDQIAPIVQNSKRFGQQIGSVNTEVGFVCLMNALNDEEPFALHRNNDNVIQAIGLTKKSTQEYIRPNIGKHDGCPLLTEVVQMPEARRQPGQARHVKVYDLYWEALVAFSYSRATC